MVEAAVGGSDEEGGSNANERVGGGSDDGKDVRPGSSSPPGDDPTQGKPRQWLIDRMFGKSPPPESKPPSFICYVPPVLALAPDIFEQNCFCESVGKLGVVEPDRSVWRRRLMRTALFFNFVAMALAITACFAISVKFGILQNIQFTKGTVVVTNLTGSGNQLDPLTADINIGLRAVAYSGDLFGERVYTFDEFCDYNGTGLGLIITPSSCASCAEVSDGLVITLAMSAFPYIPSMITNVIRSYSNYDINCMKMSSTFVALIAMGLALYSFLGYRFRCFFTFREGEYYFAQNLTEVPKDADEAVGMVNVSWSPGNGLICIILATALIGMDVILNLMVPSPSIARDREKQAEYERLSTSGVTMDTSPSAFVGAFVDLIRGRDSKKQEPDPGPGESSMDT